MHDWRLLGTRRRPLNSYGSDVESTWQCERCGRSLRTDDDGTHIPDYGMSDDCDKEVIKKVMES